MMSGKQQYTHRTETITVKSVQQNKTQPTSEEINAKHDTLTVAIKQDHKIAHKTETCDLSQQCHLLEVVLC
jgi:hypothetical protein